MHNTCCRSSEFACPGTAGTDEAQIVSATPRLSRDPNWLTLQFALFGNLLPVVLCACASSSIFPFTSARAAFGLFRADDDVTDDDDDDDVIAASVTSSSAAFPVPVPVVVVGGGGDRRFIFIRIPRSTMVARWSDIIDASSGGSRQMMRISNARFNDRERLSQRLQQPNARRDAAVPSLQLLASRGPSKRARLSAIHIICFALTITEYTVKTQTHEGNVTDKFKINLQ